MSDQWQELKETITELRDNDGTGTQQEVCKFLVNYMEVLEKQMSGSQNLNTEIKVGDEVITKYAERAVAVRDTYYIGADREPFTLIWFGTHMSSCRVNGLVKTGRRFPQIAEIMAELRGAENDERRSNQIYE